MMKREGAHGDGKGWECELGNCFQTLTILSPNCVTLGQRPRLNHSEVEGGELMQIATSTEHRFYPVPPYYIHLDMSTH